MNQPKPFLRPNAAEGRVFFFGLFGLLALLTILVLFPFLNTIGLAIVLVLVLQPLYRFFLRYTWLQQHPGWALALTLISATLIVLIPLYLFLSIAFAQGRQLFTELALPEGDWAIDELLFQIEAFIQQLIGGAFTLDLTMLADSLRSLAQAALSWIGNLAISLGTSIPALVAEAFVFFLLLILWMPRYRADQEQLVAISPLPAAVTRLYLQKAAAMLNAMFRGVFIISFAQGAAMGLFFWIAGVPFAFFLTIISMVLAVFPVIGVFLVAWPVGIILLLTGQIWQGMLVILGYLLVVTNVDNVLRPMLVPKEAYLSPALVLLSVLGGIQLMGLLGAFYGPVIMILLVTTFDVYTTYYAAEATRASSSDDGATPSPIRTRPTAQR